MTGKNSTRSQASSAVQVASLLRVNEKSVTNFQKRVPGRLPEFVNFRYPAYGSKTKTKEAFAMNTWESIFVQSPVNEGHYDEEELPHLNWNWPRETWFQTRFNQMRVHQLAASLRAFRRLGPNAEPHLLCS